MPQLMGTKSSSGGRVTADNATDLVAGDFTLGAGWGTTPVLAITAGSNDVSGHFTITCDATAAQATATVVIAFTDGDYPNTPHAIVTMFSDNAITDSGSVRAVCTTSQITITCDVLPVDTKVYTFSYLVIGK